MRDHKGASFEPFEVDWKSIDGAESGSGSAELPQVIKQLFSDCEEERETAYWQIDNKVVVQGTLYEAAPYAARLIVDGVLSDPKRVNEEVLNLLFELANGASKSKVEHGPWAGQDIESLTYAIVQETESVLREVDQVGLLQNTQDVLDCLEDNRGKTGWEQISS